jgi:uncharacterized protein YndB with AHSA1/START domain
MFRKKEEAMTGPVAAAEIDIAAPAPAVWQALTDPERIKQYFMGATVETDWQPGSPITWSGEYNGKPFQDKGSIIEVQPQRLLVLTHFSPMTGQPDLPENYHKITYRLAEQDGKTNLSLSQDNNGSDDEVKHSRTTWQNMLEAIKRLVESDPA